MIDFLFGPGEWDRLVEQSRKKSSAEYYGNPENRWENQDRTPLGIVQDAMDWELYSDYNYDND